MALPKDFREFLELLNSHGVEYVIVGGFALAWHGRPRFTGDIDILIRRTPENARRTADVVEAFGFRPLEVTADELMKEGQIVQMGVRPSHRCHYIHFGSRYRTGVAEARCR